MIKKVDLAKKVDCKKKAWSAIRKETQAKPVPSLLSFKLRYKDHPKGLKGFQAMKRVDFKDSVSRRISIWKFAEKAAKKVSSQSTMAVAVERKLKPKGSPRKVEIQSLSELYLICDFYSKYSRQIPKQIMSRPKASIEDFKESYISLLQREFSKSTDLGWPFNRRTTSKNMDEPESIDIEIVEVSYSSVSSDVIESPKSRPGWPLLLIPVPPKSDDSSSECHVEKSESPVNQPELDLLLKEADSSGCKIFKYEHLKNATSQFSLENIIGEGGCSSVYKGHLENGKTVAVKLLKPYKEAWNDFSLQVKIASSIKHQNIVPLLGICLEHGLLISVHDFYPKGSLEDCLHGDKSGSVLPWKVRFNVAVAIAEALNYLHSKCIIHRDVKSSNILLTGELQPQLSDFGLAIWGSVDSAYLVDCDVAGTFGYIAPEYFMYGRVSEKIDVYAFGVVLLELLTGRKPICAKVPQGQESLVKWAEKLLDGGDYEALLDPKLKGDFDAVEMHRMVLAARLCISKSPRLRPKVGLILKLLKQYMDDASEPCDASLLEPNEAGFEDEEENSIFRYGLVNDSGFAILNADNESMSPSRDGRNTPFPGTKETRRLKLKDFLNQRQD